MTRLPRSPFRRLSWLSLAALALIAAWAALVPAARAQTEAKVELGAPAPDLVFTAVDGSQRRLSEFQGRPTMLWFFATWCPTCVAGTRAVAENLDWLRQAGIQIIQLKLYNNLGYSGASVTDFAARHAGAVAPSPDWLWGDASLEGSITYDPRGYPDIYFLIDKDGIVRAIEPAPHATMDKIRRFAESIR